MSWTRQPRYRIRKRFAKSQKQAEFTSQRTVIYIDIKTVIFSTVIDTESGKLEIIRKVDKILAKYEIDKYYTFYVVYVFSICAVGTELCGSAWYWELLRVVMT